MSEVVAILAIRNEEAYLANCLRHLVRNGLRVAIIDHGSTDSSPQIYCAPEFREHLIGVWSTPFTGVFSLRRQLKLKLEVAAAVGGDWIVHLDADEIMHTYREGESLADGLRRLGAAGWNAVNFDEFVFLPIDRDYAPNADGLPNLELYYFHEPYSPRLMRAWKNGLGLSMIDGAGHELDGSRLRLAPESFALRHYIFRSQAHALEKYAARVFSEEDLELGWHENRIGLPPERFRFPPSTQLNRLVRIEDRLLDRSHALREHFWRWSSTAERQTG